MYMYMYVHNVHDYMITWNTSCNLAYLAYSNPLQSPIQQTCNTDSNSKLSLLLCIVQCSTPAEWIWRLGISTYLTTCLLSGHYLSSHV